MKEYRFKRSRGPLPQDTEEYTLREDQLDKHHEDLLLGELINHYNKLPVKLQKQFKIELRKAFKKQ